MSTNPPNTASSGTIFGKAQPQSAESGQAPGNADSATLGETAPQGSNPPVGKHAGEDENNPIDQTQVESLQQGAAAQSAAAQQASGDPAGGAPAEDSATGDKPVLAEYTSGSIRNFRVGRFQFEDGRLVLRDQADVDRFEQLRKSLSVRDAAIIVNVNDTKANADRLAQRFLADSTMRRGVDTSEPKPGEPR
jgi:hypothetical protein